MSCQANSLFRKIYTWLRYRWHQGHGHHSRARRMYIFNVLLKCWRFTLILVYSTPPKTRISCVLRKPRASHAVARPCLKQGRGLGTYCRISQPLLRLQNFSIYQILIWCGFRKLETRRFWFHQSYKSSQMILLYFFSYYYFNRPINLFF